ncbi:ABC transporter related [Candidatus Promineifilum breve]|uniref:ABC transporter related n=1 Tax=Candidatus Promineifilum breve TaxID=1806508 RepID=A0A170PJF1_9CHLR|nr:ABC transporter ATP-binding protein [Candidatus Promineifilum breve]CUS05507.2 ABC transporter related [Candidatus Promineifilum breve]
MGEFAIHSHKPANHRSPGRWLLSHLARHWLLFVIMVIGAFGNAALAAAMPILIGLAFNAALAEPPNLDTIGLAALGVLASQVIRAFLQLGRNFASSVMGERLERDTRQELYISLLGKSMTFHDLQPVGDTMARATNDVRELNLMMNPGINLVVGSANFLVMPLLLAPRYHWQLIAAPLFFVVGYVLSLIRYMNVLSHIADRVRLSFGALNARLAEAIDGIEMVKSTAQETAEVGRFERNARAYRDATVAQGREEAKFLPLLLLGLTEGIGFTHALLLLRAGQIQVGDVVAYMGLLALFGFPTFISLMAYSRVSLGVAGARRILELINTETDLDENPEGFAGTIAGEVRFENISFGYVPGVDTLGQIDFTVRPGQTVAIVGQTGAGKSTLTKLINRTYDAREGRVLVDGVDVRDWSLAALRRQISIIEQDIFLFSRTIGENIAFGAPEATREQIEAAAHAAQAHDFIMSFEDGYETVVGERGVTLSGGQRQRIALARAFLTNPRILILDDSTSAVDSATEDQIQRAIRHAAENRTTFLITHRLSQIRWADLVVVLRKGRLEAIGDHATLMAASPAYRLIFEQYEALEG